MAHVLHYDIEGGDSICGNEEEGLWVVGHFVDVANLAASDELQSRAVGLEQSSGHCERGLGGQRGMSR